MTMKPMAPSPLFSKRMYTGRAKSGLAFGGFDDDKRTIEVSDAIRIAPAHLRQSGQCDRWQKPICCRKPQKSKKQPALSRGPWACPPALAPRLVCGHCRNLEQRQPPGVGNVTYLPY
jgi:hypothetical protein